MNRLTTPCTRGTLLVLLLSCAAVADRTLGDVRLPHVLGSHMVLQRDMPVPIWGWAEPGETVAIAFAGHLADATADASGRWQVKLPALAAGGPHELVVRGNNEIRLTDVLIGEVWLCSGQSNMEMGVGVAADGEKEIAAAEFPRIRLLELPRSPAGEPVDDIRADWRVCGPDTLGGWWGGFSAVGYFFGRELHQKLDVPIGLIDSCWGGTRIEPWTPPCGFAAVPSLTSVVDECRTKCDAYRDRDLPANLTELEKWIANTRAALTANQPLPASPNWPRHPLQSERAATGLYNGMIHPLVPFAIRGAIWYQGEANVYPCDGMAYTEKMKALIDGWREVWGQGDFPFYYVQLAPFKYTLHRNDIKPDQLPRIWEAQLAALSIPHTGMAVLTDLGDWRDIHPKKKQEVGRRLALWALAHDYGKKDLVHSGPLYREMAIEGTQIRLRFDHVGGGLKTRDGQPPNWFEVAGENQQFVNAQAKIDGDAVVVWSDEVAKPAAVRFAWHMLPEPIPNLINAEGLPASPFRTQQP